MTIENPDIRPDQLVPGARIVVTGGIETVYGTIVRMATSRVGWFAYDDPRGGPSDECAMFHLYNVAAIVDLWSPWAEPVDGYCCVDSWASREWSAPLHTGGCAWRCRKPIRVPRELHSPGIMPCPLTAAHDGDCAEPNLEAYTDARR